jgi:hypothetical protein
MTKEKLDELKTTMIKMKITILIRVPKEATAEFSAAEVHIATIRELSKQRCESDSPRPPRNQSCEHSQIIRTGEVHRLFSTAREIVKQWINTSEHRSSCLIGIGKLQ